MLLYKILLPAEWAEFEAAGRFDGSPFDHDSGFIHCSWRSQVAATAVRFFADEPSLVIAVLDGEVFGDILRRERASNGEVFPHIYGDLPLSAVERVHRIAGPSSVDEVLLHRERPLLDNVLRNATRVRVTDGGMTDYHPVSDVVIADVSDAAGLEQLRIAMAVASVPDGMCMCLGDVAFEFFDPLGERIALVGLHYDSSLRWSGWDGDADLVDGSRVSQWLADRRS